MRHYQRSSDEFKTESGVLYLLSKIEQKVFPNGITQAELIKFLYAAQHVSRDRQRSDAKASKAGRRSKYDRDFLIGSISKIKMLLSDQTKDRISFGRFVASYLPVLNYPPDIKTALNKDKINLEEAGLLARINTRNLPSDTRRKAVEIRREMLESHLKRMGSQTELRKRVKEKLLINSKTEADEVSVQLAQVEKNVDELLEFNEFDTDHLLWEETKSLVFLFRELDTALIDDDTLIELLKDLENFKTRLSKFKRPAVVEKRLFTI